MAQHTFNMSAVSATIRYNQGLQRYEHNEEWATLRSVYFEKKRRFQSIPFDVFRTLVQLERDHGHPRFQLHTDAEGIEWIRAVPYEERHTQ